jgi:putative sporulation protein YtaF
MDLFYVITLGIAVSIDGFIAGSAYGLKNIRMPGKSLFIVFAVTGLCSAFAMFCAYVLAQLMNTSLALAIGACLLMILGVWSIFQQYLTKNVPTYETDGEVTAKELTFSIGRLVISIMAKPETADVDRLGFISSLEAVFLALAVGLDGMIGTFAAALMGPLPLYTPVVVGLIHLLCVYGGCVTAARLISDRIKERLPYFPGVLLIIMGLLRL